MERVETCVTHLSTSTYRQAPAIIFLRFRIRDAVSLDINTLLMRSLHPLGGACACPDGDSVDIAGRSPRRLGERDCSWSARTRPGIVERVTASASNIERINHRSAHERPYLRLRFTRFHVYKAKETSKSPPRRSCSWGEIQETQAHVELGGRLGFSLGMGRDQRRGRVGNY